MPIGEKGRKVFNRTVKRTNTKNEEKMEQKVRGRRGYHFSIVTGSENVSIGLKDRVESREKYIEERVHLPQSWKSYDFIITGGGQFRSRRETGRFLEMYNPTEVHGVTLHAKVTQLVLDSRENTRFLIWGQIVFFSLGVSWTGL